MSVAQLVLTPEEVVIAGFDTEADEDDPHVDPRASWDVDPKLVAAIKMVGVLQPIKVRKVGSGSYVVVDGRQRVKAARQANVELAASSEPQVKIQCTELKGDDVRAEMVKLMLNEYRQNDTVLEQAFNAVRMYDRAGGDVDLVALTFGKSKVTISNWLSLASAIPAVHTALREKSISNKVATDISKLPRDEQEAALQRELRATGDIDVDGEKKEKKEKKTTTKDPKIQKGITRSWIRKALKTKAAESIPEEDRALLHWVATGEGDPTSWYEVFRQEVNIELGI